MTAYQDSWKNGECEAGGVRECASRYQIVRRFCSGYQRPFSVCDIGANMCYFGIRLNEDFPECSVMAFEFDHYDLRAKHLAESGADRVMLIDRKVSLRDVEMLRTFCRFDLVLALSVMHHLPGDFGAWLDALASLGDCLIAEFAMDDSRRVHGRKGYHVPDDAVILGHGRSHLRDGATRPIVLLSGRTA
jgi:hypothetical protein